MTLDKPASNKSLSRFILLLMTTTIAATAADLYYNQLILPLICAKFQLTDLQLSSIPKLTQFGLRYQYIDINEYKSND